MSIKNCYTKNLHRHHRVKEWVAELKRGLASQFGTLDLLREDNQSFRPRVEEVCKTEELLEQLQNMRNSLSVLYFSIAEKNSSEEAASKSKQEMKECTEFDVFRKCDIPMYTTHWQLTMFYSFLIPGCKDFIRKFIQIQTFSHTEHEEVFFILTYSTFARTQCASTQRSLSECRRRYGTLC